MSGDPYAQQEALLGRIDNTLGRMIDSGQQGTDVFTALSQSRSGVASNLPGMPGYDSSARAAESYMQQADAQMADASRAGASSDPDFAAACPECQPGEPCCLRAFEVEDSEDGSRKVVWPVPQDGPSRLYVVAKEPVGLRPSAKAKIKLTDVEPCKVGRIDPSVDPSRHAAGPQSITDEGEITVTTPFQMPGFSSSLLPREVMMVIYLVGALIQSATYSNHSPARARPAQCMIPRNRGLEVFAVPHMSLTCEVSGELGVTFSLAQLAVPSAGISGSITGEIGNETISWSASRTIMDRPRSQTRQGPVNHPLFDFLESIQSSMDVLADTPERTNYDRGILAAPNPTSLSVKITVSVAVGGELKGKGGSPNLELTLDPCRFSLSPDVRGTVDIVELMLSRIPYGRDIREALAHDGNAVSAEAKCEVSVGGSGTGMVEGLNIASVEIGGPDIDTQLSGVDVRYTASCELTGRISASASLDVRTWLIDANASAGASVSTGWQFGGRVTDNSDGTQKWEKMHHFQGIILRAYARLRFGSEARSGSTDPLAGQPDDSPTETVVRTTDAFSVETDAGGYDWEATLLHPNGDPEDWYEVQ